MSDIRVTYSGLIAFATSLTAVFTGLMFTLIITRTLTPEEFGTWSLILSLITYSLVIEPLISYWTTRDIARGEQVGKTSIIASGVSSIGGSFIFLIIAYILTQQTNVEQDIIFLSIILVPLGFIKNILHAINIGWKPQASSYGILVSEIIKVPLGLYFVYFLQMGILGVLITFVIAYIFNIFILIYFAKVKILNKFQKKFVKKWIKNSLFTLYLNGATIVIKLDILIFVLIIDSVEIVAIFTVAMIVSSLTAHAAAISSATYPKLLSGERGSYLQKNITRFVYFSVPLSLISIFFAKPALFALNPIYEVAIICVILLTIRTILTSTNNVLSGFIYGIDTVDKNINSGIKDYFKSSISRVTLIKFIFNLSYLIGLTIGLIVLKQNLINELDLIIFWSGIALITQIPYTVYLSLRVRKHFDVKLESKNILKYIFSGIISFFIPFLISENFLEYSNNVLEFIPRLLVFILLGIGIYLCITYLIDSRTKELMKSIIQELKKR